MPESIIGFDQSLGRMVKFSIENPGMRVRERERVVLFINIVENYKYKVRQLHTAIKTR